MRIRVTLLLAAMIATVGLAFNPSTHFTPVTVHADCTDGTVTGSTVHDVVQTLNANAVVTYLIAYKDTCLNYLYELEVYDASGAYMSVGGLGNITDWVCGISPDYAATSWPGGQTMYFTSITHRNPTGWVTGYNGCGPQADDIEHSIPTVSSWINVNGSSATLGYVNF